MGANHSHKSVSGGSPRAARASLTTVAQRALEAILEAAKLAWLLYVVVHALATLRFADRDESDVGKRERELGLAHAYPNSELPT